MIRYTTAAGVAHAEQTIEKSRFIAHVSSVNSREEAEAFIASIRLQYKDATHNVPAFVIGEKMQLQWGSDDGEPQGTSGAPIVQMLVKMGLTNICVVVTRYFGGVKLGTGGLVRAYTSSAKMAVEAAGEKKVKDVVELSFKLDYNLQGKILNLEKDLPFDILSIEYEECLKLRAAMDPDFETQFTELLSELTSGKAHIDARVEKIE